MWAFQRQPDYVHHLLNFALWPDLLVTAVVALAIALLGVASTADAQVVLTENATDEGQPAYKIETPQATWFLEKTGAGLSSLIDPEGNDWLGFHPEPGSGAAGEYRGFPNAVHQQGGNYFHPKNDATDRAITRIEHVAPDRVTIRATSDNGLWECRYDFFASHCTFTMMRLPPRRQYWVLYEGTPGGSYGDDDWWMTSAIDEKQPLTENHEGDIPAPEWIVFGDRRRERVVFLLHHEDDEHADNFYAMQQKMTVFGFGRRGIEKFLQDVPQQFSIGLIESADHGTIGRAIDQLPRDVPRPSVDASPGYPPTGQFQQLHYLQMGFEHGNAKYRDGDNWFRVNSPGVSLDSNIKQRYETRYNGLMMIRADTDITSLAGAELYMEVWGGHPGTFNKRVSVNGRTTYPIPEVGSADHHCTHSYPVVQLSLSDLVRGYNAFQFACDKEEGWGHFIVHDACLKLQLPPDHPAVAGAGLESFAASVKAEPLADNAETIALALEIAPELANHIARVDYQAFYEGYDENGNGLTRDWHGLTHRRQPTAWAGEATEMPFTCDWNVSMLPAQEEIAVRATIAFKDPPNLLYTTPPVHGLVVPNRLQHQVLLLGPTEIPVPFWSRASRKKSCEINLPVPPDSVEQAILHIAVWGGGHGTIEKYFTLNGHFFPIAPPRERGPIYYHQIEVPVSCLQQGGNRIELLSDTQHHGIEVLLPGPVLAVRIRK